MSGGVAISSKNGALTVTESLISNSGAGTVIAATATSVLGLTAIAAASNYGKIVAGNTYELGNSTSQVSNLNYAGTLVASQSLTVSANDAAGASHGLTITLAAGSGAGGTDTIDKTIGSINDQLQASFDATLQQITAVKVNTNGIDQINFVSSVKNFSVGIGSDASGYTSTGPVGVTDSNSATAKTEYSVQNGTGGAADISTVAGAQAAVAAITAAVSSLGAAQANVGKGQNALGFAISLAQSQITNLSAAEANIRDANVAQQAANLTKAQTLQQASIAAMAQANSAPQAVLTLLRG